MFPKAIWPIRFSSKFVARLNDYATDQIFYVLGFVYLLACGTFKTKHELGLAYGYARALEVKTIPFNRFLVVKIYREKNLFVQIGV